MEQRGFWREGDDSARVLQGYSCLGQLQLCTVATVWPVAIVSLLRTLVAVSLFRAVGAFVLFAKDSCRARSQLQCETAVAIRIRDL